MVYGRNKKYQGYVLLDECTFTKNALINVELKPNVSSCFTRSVLIFGSKKCGCSGMFEM